MKTADHDAKALTVVCQWFLTTTVTSLMLMRFLAARFMDTVSELRKAEIELHKLFAPLAALAGRTWDECNSDSDGLSDLRTLS